MIKRDGDDKKEFRADTPLQVLLFTLKGVHFAVDMEQISAMKNPETLDPLKYRIFRFHEKVPLPGQVIYQCPKALIIKGSGKGQDMRAVIVDNPMDIVSIDVKSLRLLPALVNAYDRGSPLWGAFILAGAIVLMVDCFRLQP